MSIETIEITIPPSQEPEPASSQETSWKGRLVERFSECYTWAFVLSHPDVVASIIGVAVSAIYFVSCALAGNIAGSALSLLASGIFVYIISRTSDLSRATKKIAEINDQLRATNDRHAEINKKFASEVNNLKATSEKIKEDFGKLPPQIKNEIENLQEERFKLGQNVAKLETQAEFLEERLAEIKAQNDLYRKENARHSKETDKLSVMIDRVETIMDSNLPVQTSAPLSQSSE